MMPSATPGVSGPGISLKPRASSNSYTILVVLNVVIHDHADNTHHHTTGQGESRFAVLHAEAFRVAVKGLNTIHFGSSGPRRTI